MKLNKGNSFITKKRLHVFIADDDLDDLQFFESAVKEISENVKITIAKNGLELLEFVQLVTPDMIFLDINMPCMNGLDCLAELRKLQQLREVPIIMYSTGSKEAHIDKAYSLGANRYVQKPANFSSIKDQLTEVLSLKHSDLIPQPARDKFYVSLCLS